MSVSKLKIVEFTSPYKRPLGINAQQIVAKRYSLKDLQGNALETWDDIVKRVVSHVAKAEQDFIKVWGSSVTAISDECDIRVIFHARNKGKGGAIQTAMRASTGAVLIIQDADLEYDPADYRALLQPMIEGEADVVYGSRFSHIDGPVHHYWHRWGNQMLTRLSNWKSGWTLTDEKGIPS